MYCAWDMAGPLTVCPNTVCAQQFNHDHTLYCPTGGYSTEYHNKFQDLLASLMTEVSTNVAIGPVLQPLTAAIETSAVGQHQLTTSHIWRFMQEASEGNRSYTVHVPTSLQWLMEMALRRRHATSCLPSKDVQSMTMRVYALAGNHSTLLNMACKCTALLH